MWWREFRGGIAMAARRWPAMLGVATLVAATCAMLALTLGDIWAQVGVLRAGAVLRERDAVMFTVWYPVNATTDVSAKMIAGVASPVRAGDAYTAVLNNGFTDDPERSDDPPVLLVGDVVPELFPDLELCDPAPCAMRGAARPAVPDDVVRVAGHRVPVSATLPAGASFFDPNAGVRKLDSRIVVRLAPGDLARLNPDAREEAVHRTVLLAPDAASVEALVTASAARELYLVPQSLASRQSVSTRDSLTTAIMFTIGGLAFLALVLLAFSAVARDAVAREARAFAIRRLHGAPGAALATRTAGFLSCVILVPPLLPLGALAAVAGPFVSQSVPLVAAVVVVVFLVLWLRITNQVTSRSFAELL